MDTSLKPSLAMNRSPAPTKARISDPSYLAKQIIGCLERAPNMQSANAYLVDSQRLHAEIFAKCFQSRQLMCYMIEQVRNQDFILLLLQYSTADRQHIRPSVEKRIGLEYLKLVPEMNMMAATADQVIRERLASYNESKIRLIHSVFLQPFGKKLGAEVLVIWLALLPCDMKSNLNSGIYVYIKNELLPQQNIMNYEVLFDLVLKDMVGGGNLTQFLTATTVTNPTIAEMIVLYCQLRGCSIGHLFVLLTKRMKPARMLDIAKDAVIQIMNRPNPQPQYIADLFVKYGVPVVLKQMMPRNTNYPQSQRFLRELLQYSQVLPPETITRQTANELIARPNRLNIYQHLLLLQEIFKKCMSPKYAQGYAKHMDAYIDKYRSGEFVQQNNSIPDNTNDAVLSSSITHQAVQQSLEFVGLPNIGNTCYINSILHALYFCKAFIQPFSRAETTDKSLVAMQKVYAELRKRDRSKLEGLMKQLKAQLPQDFSGNFSQQDVMELGRYLIDRLVSTNAEMKKVFEIKIKETIKCPDGDVIGERICNEYFMMLSFPDPQLFSKLGTQSKIVNVSELTKMIEGDFFSNVQIQSQFECQKCKKVFHQRERQQRLVQMPDLLVIVLSRFSYDIQNSAKRKVCDRVRMENYLMFGLLTNKNKPDNYKLIAFINHMGKNAESGHYQAYIRHPKVDKWLNFDDEFITETPHTKVADLMSNFSQYDSPYVLFFERT